ncbi:hypothetical protein ASG73_12175 [Janibacter sp. Soil728]|uniref:helix-turn-helix domain-containing protein n=1 Tax=Janibacter sp. Soil728 TaxID=1736393 RepID=UPI0007002A60|nr:helix-turn-helix transcriptional regulator [Janibacter sp. Soil728]KRE37055.1 hypothetical protein ASG73_12175 [Janibacter sp. Soil728]
MEPVDVDPAEQSSLTCPMDCAVCKEPGDCEDCLDCLYWPNVVEDDLWHPPAPRGRSLPTKTAQMEDARSRIVTSRRVGLVSRRFRRLARLSQRELAAELGWSHTSVGRMEKDAATMPLGKIEALLQRAGYRFAIVAKDAATPTEASDDLWEAADLIARDQAGRRPSPLGSVTWHPPEDLRQDSSLRGREWTWQRPAS